MKKNYLKIFISSLIIPVIGVMVIDYFFHFFFSHPQETLGYFLGKMIVYFAFSLIFLLVFNLEKRELLKVTLGGIVVALIWGSYYNVLPWLFEYYPYGIPLSGLSFLGMGILGTGLAFGIVHVLAFIGGYYAGKLALKGWKA